MESNDVRAPRLLTLAEAAERLGISRQCLRDWNAAGRLRFTRIGPRTPRVAEDDLAEFIEKGRAQE